MVITATVLATLLNGPLTKAFGWTLSEALKGTHNKNIEKSLKTLSTRITEVVKVKNIYKTIVCTLCVKGCVKVLYFRIVKNYCSKSVC